MAHRGLRRFSTEGLKLLDKLVAKLQAVKWNWTTDSEKVRWATLAYEAEKRAAHHATEKVRWATLAYEAEKRAAHHATEASKRTMEAMMEVMKEALEAKKETLEAQKLALQVQKEAFQEQKEAKAALLLELLRVQGLNDARGLFEYLQEKVIDLHPSTQGLKGSELTWSKVLSANATLTLCLRKHLGNACNLSSHLATTYSMVSQHIHAGKYLSLHQGTIEFESDFLTPEQCATYVCLGTAAGVSCTPAPRRRITTVLAAATPAPAPATEGAAP